MIPIADYPDYFTTDDGRVWSAKRLTIVALAQRIDVNGYCIVNLYQHGQRHTKRVHCLIANNHVAGKARGLEVNHVDGDKTNNAATNLEWVTHAQNCKHAFTAGLRRPPTSTANTGRTNKLSRDDIRAIRAFPPGVTHQSLAIVFNVHKRTVARIRTRDAWPDI